MDKYVLEKDIRKNKLYKLDVPKRNKRARKILTEDYDIIKNQKIFPGQLLMFNYYQPKNKEELEYYDAQPITIFFNNVMTNEGRRVIGFNLHYYPPSIRFWIMNKIFEIFRNIWEDNFEKGVDKKIIKFNYNYIIKHLKKYDLTFGVRMYDPKLMAKVRNIPPKSFATAVFTEGLFKKKTREYILQYWKKWLNKGE